MSDLPTWKGSVLHLNLRFCCARSPSWGEKKKQNAFAERFNHGQPHRNAALCVIGAFMQNRATVCRGCNVRLIPAFVECDRGGGKGGAEWSCLPAEPTNTGSRQLPRRRAIVLGRLVWWPFTEMWRLRRAVMVG